MQNIKRPLLFPSSATRAVLTALFPAIVLIAAIIQLFPYEREPEKYTVSYYGLFDTQTTVTAYMRDREDFGRLSGVIYGRLKELHESYDIYNDYEGRNNLKTVNDMAGIAPVTVNADIINLVSFAKEYCGITGGAVNAAIGPVTALWREFLGGGGPPPDAASLEMASGLTDIDKVIVTGNTIFLSETGMSLDVGAVAKGYAVKLASDAAKASGYGDFLIDAGGDVHASGMPYGRDGWIIGIQDPDAANGIAKAFSLTNKSAVTSGDYQRFREYGGVRYGHIIDPETNTPAGRYRSVTVIHPDCGAADALSTALFILPIDEGTALARERGASAVWIMEDKSTVTYP